MTDPSPPPPRRRPIVSPCVAVCVIDPAAGYCRGCKRTIDEIARWVTMGDDARERVLAELPSRPDPVAPVPS
ncbi:MAG: DUF1289 domain-containing protein [Rhodospirillales bacterium]|nr:MAG: DUF1289 domain-containing protein [Rhodospirillales bacterium]